MTSSYFITISPRSQLVPSRSYRSYLTDLVFACDEIAYFQEDIHNFRDYEEKRMHRAAIERFLLMIGEALAQMRQHFPRVYEDISHVRQIVAFRNRLMHAYLHTDNVTVWKILNEYIPLLRQEASSTLESLEP